MGGGSPSNPHATRRMLGLHRRRLASSGKGLPSATSCSAAFEAGSVWGWVGCGGDACGPHGARGATGRAYEDQLMKEIPPFCRCAGGVRR